VNNSNHEGIVLSTFHGLKGLEFDNVIMIDLDNDIFPNFPLIHSKGYGEDVELMLKEAETRLFYVAITRAISNLTMYYSSSNPSIYISELYGKNATIADSNKEEDEKLEIKTMDVFEDFDVLSEVDSSNSSSNDEFEDFDVFSDIDNNNKLDSIDVIDSPLGSSKTTSLKMKSLLDCF
jgi:ATP-dependent exoDNAse (exonuclease V) beta subunit